MRINQAGEQRLPLAVKSPIGLHWRLVPSAEQLADLAIGRNGQAAEAHDLAAGVQCDAVDIIDPAIGKGGGGEKECQAQQLFNHGRTMA
jgi:hypothetical protein